jgi:hypothetical protein
MPPTCLSRRAHYRRCSIESFVVCQGYAPPPGFTPSMLTPLLDRKYSANNSAGPNSQLGPCGMVVPFVACGDLSGFDADQSYPLDLEATAQHQQQQQMQRHGRGEGGGEGGSIGGGSVASSAAAYQVLNPAAPPIRPPYQTAMALRKDGSDGTSGAHQ